MSRDPGCKPLKRKEIFDRALQETDPSNVDAMIGKASCLVVEVISGWSTSVSEDQKAAADFADKALSKRPASAPAHVIKGDVLRYGHPEDAVREYDAALEIDPNFPVAYADRYRASPLLGRAREAFSPIELALRISPKDPFAFQWRFFLCHAHLHLHEYKEVVEECRRSTYLSNSFWPPYVDLVSAFGATGQLEQAQSALAVLYECRRTSPSNGIVNLATHSQAIRSIAGKLLTSSTGSEKGRCPGAIKHGYCSRAVSVCFWHL